MALFYPRLTHQIGGNTAGATANISSGTALWAGGNNITLSQNANSITISAGGGGGTFSGGMSDIGNTSGTTGLVSDRLVIAGGNNITLSQSVNGNSATLTISGGGGGGTFSAGISTQGNTAGTTGFATDRMVFVGSGGVSLSQSVNGGSATLTIHDIQGTLSQWRPDYWGSWGNGQLGNASLYFHPVYIPEFASFSRGDLVCSFSISSSSNSSHGGTLSVHFGWYSRNVSTLSLASSGSATYAWTNTSNNSTSVLAGQRLVSVPINVSATPGAWYLGILTRSSTVNANWWTGSNVFFSKYNTAFSGLFGVASNASNQAMLGMGFHATTQSTLPASVAFSDLRGTAAAAMSVPFVHFCNFSV